MYVLRANVSTPDHLVLHTGSAFDHIIKNTRRMLCVNYCLGNQCRNEYKYIYIYTTYITVYQTVVYGQVTRILPRPRFSRDTGQCFLPQRYNFILFLYMCVFQTTIFTCNSYFFPCDPIDLARVDAFADLAQSLRTAVARETVLSSTYTMALAHIRVYIYILTHRHGHTDTYTYKYICHTDQTGKQTKTI